MLDGDTSDIIDSYNRDIEQSQINANTGIMDERTRRGSGDVRFTSIFIKDAKDNQPSMFEMGETLRFEMAYEVFSAIQGLSVSVALRSGRSNEFVTTVKHRVTERRLEKGEKGMLIVEMPNIVLRPGEYPLYFWLGNSSAQPYDVVDGLTAPLIVQTEKSPEELHFDPTRPVGIFDIESKLIVG